MRNLRYANPDMLKINRIKLATIRQIWESEEKQQQYYDALNRIHDADEAFAEHVKTVRLN